jgi:hypothetical protein
MQGPFDNQIIGVACPYCGTQHPQTIAWLKQNREIPCGCGRTITLDPDEFAAALAEIERQLTNIGGGTKH